MYLKCSAKMPSPVSTWSLTKPLINKTLHSSAYFSKLPVLEKTFSYVFRTTGIRRQWRGGGRGPTPSPIGNSAPATRIHKVILQETTATIGRWYCTHYKLSNP